MLIDKTLKRENTEINLRKQLLLPFKFVILTTLLVILLPLQPHVQADNQSWIKSNNNPVTTSLDNNINSPSVIQNSDELIFFMSKNSGSGWRIFKSTLSNNQWKDTAEDIIPIGSSDNWENEVSDPEVIKIGSRYHMWYTSLNNTHWVSGSDRFRTRYAYSDDGTTWTRSEKWVLKGEKEKWDEGGTTRGRSVLYHNNKYHMWYAGTNTNDLSRNPFWRIGYAISVDGVSWQKQNDGNPVVVPTETWEKNNTSYPNVIYDKGKFKMWYATSTGDLPTSFAYAESLDGVNWNKPADLNPILETTPGGFDSRYISDPYIVKSSNVLSMYYAGFNGSNWSIGVATSILSSPSVPLLKQTSNPWQDDVYDRANIWSPSNYSINRWGCAVTSAAMILQYHGYKKLPDGTDLDPGTLNAWLNSQRDGYVGNGLLNWIALSRLSNQAKGINDITTHDALEFIRTGRNNALLESDLNDGNPAILSQPGHFVVGTEKLTDTFAINDPYFDRNTLKDGYGNTYQGLYRFIPSNTDLSYIMMVIPKDLNIEVYDESNNLVGENYTEPALVAPDDNTSSSGTDSKVLYIPKPLNGKYTVKVRSNNAKFFSAEMYVYDVDGSPLILTLAGNPSTSATDYLLNFNKDNGEEIYISKIVTYESILKDLQNGFKNKLINKGTYSSLTALIKSSQKDYTKKKIKTAKLKIDTTRLLVSAVFSRTINDAFERTLLSDLKSLKSSL